MRHRARYRQDFGTCMFCKKVFPIKELVVGVGKHAIEEIHGKTTLDSEKNAFATGEK